MIALINSLGNLFGGFCGDNIIYNTYYWYWLWISLILSLDFVLSRSRRQNIGPTSVILTAVFRIIPQQFQFSEIFSDGKPRFLLKSISQVSTTFYLDQNHCVTKIRIQITDRTHKYEVISKEWKSKQDQQHNGYNFYNILFIYFLYLFLLYIFIFINMKVYIFIFSLPVPRNFYCKFTSENRFRWPPGSWPRPNCSPMTIITWLFWLSWFYHYDKDVHLSRVGTAISSECNDKHRATPNCKTMGWHIYVYNCDSYSIMLSLARLFSRREFSSGQCPKGKFTPGRWVLGWHILQINTN